MKNHSSTTSLGTINTVASTLRPTWRLLVFDWDGTLFDSTAHIVLAIQNAAKDVGAEVPSRTQAAWVIGLGLQEALAHALPDLSPALYRQLAERYRWHYQRLSQDIHLFEGVRPLLHDLKNAGYLLAVATGKSRSGLNAVLQQLQMQTFFDATRTADETESKPSPKMVEEILQELNVTVAACVVIGDTKHDLDMARNAACAAIGVSYGAHDEESLQEAAPIAIAQDVAQLRALLLPRDCI